MLAAERGWPCGVLCGPVLDFEDGRSLEQLLCAKQIAFDLIRGPARAFSLFQFVHHGIPVTIFQPSIMLPPDQLALGGGEDFLPVFDTVVDRFQPDVLLTFGGFWVSQQVMARARQRGLVVVFALRNFNYHHAAIFRDADAVLVPSRFAQEEYRRELGIHCTVLPGLCNLAKSRCPKIDGHYATFVNPQPEKGLFWFARMAYELERRRPDIPLLVVEGRGQAESLGYTGLDLSGLGNLHRMTCTPDPRDFYRVSRVILMPSLWRESFGRVAVEALANGIPILASRRGALPETLAQAGFLLDIPARYTPETRLVPSAEEVAPWIDTLVRLWDDAEFYEKERCRCLAAAEAWGPERLLPQYEEFFRQVVATRQRVPRF